MNQHRFNILWKFFTIIGSLLLIITIIFTKTYLNQQKEKHVESALNYLKLATNLTAMYISGEDITSALEIESTQTEEFTRIDKQIHRQYQIFNQIYTQFPIARISVLIPGNNEVKIFTSTKIPFRFLENDFWYSEIERVMTQNTIQIKTNFIEQGEYFYSAFAPIFNTNHLITGILRVDMRKANILANVPDFWSYFALFGLIALLLSFGISFTLSKIITRAIDRFVDFVNRVSEGNYHLRYEYRTFDELDKIAYAFNIMLEKLEGLIETEADRDRLQAQITSLLRIVSAAADGDFTVSAEVTADTLGALADSFNLMIHELSNLIRDVQEASEQISRSTAEILKSSEIMAVGAKNQAQDIESTYNAVKNMADIVKYASERSGQAAETATKAAEVARKGTEIVKRSIEGMHRIRETVQETARRVRALGENTQEIGEILEVISDIANRTNLLGLNATIEAARASEAGRGFAVVADEVRNLAERSSQAAKDIAVLIESIQAGTAEAVMAMEHGTEEVVKETKRVDEAGSALKEILEMVQESAKLINEISEAFQHQTKVSTDIAKAMERVAIIAHETDIGAQKSKKLSEEMALQSRRLSEAVSKFRLPSPYKNATR